MSAHHERDMSVDSTESDLSLDVIPVTVEGVDDIFDKRRSVERKLKARPLSVDLKNKNILKSDSISPALHDAQVKIRTEQTKVGLTKLINNRPDRDFLESQNIIKVGTSGIDPKTIAVQHDLRKKMLISKLERGMDLRPTLLDLEKRGVIKELHLHTDRFEVTPEEAHAIVIRIQNKGGKLAQELHKELKNYRMERCADEKSVDMLSLEKKLNLRPTRDELADKNILKMKGGDSGARILATMALSNKLKTRPEFEDLVGKGVLETGAAIIEEEE